MASCNPKTDPGDGGSPETIDLAPQTSTTELTTAFAAAAVVDGSRTRITHARGSASGTFGPLLTPPIEEPPGQPIARGQAPLTLDLSEAAPAECFRKEEKKKTEIPVVVFGPADSGYEGKICTQHTHTCIDKTGISMIFVLGEAELLAVNNTFAIKTFTSIRKTHGQQRFL